MNEKEIEISNYYIDRIVLDGGTDNPKEDMLNLAKYYQQLSESINPDNFKITASKNSLLNFETLYLWLHEKITLSLPKIKDQIENIFYENNLCEIFAILSTVTQDEILRSNRKQNMGLLGALIYSDASPSLTKDKSNLVSSRNLLNVKIALTRIAQIVRFSASKIDKSDAGPNNFNEFKSSYNPDLINKLNISALVGLFKSQLSELPKDENTTLLIDKLDSIEKEFKKKNPHWAYIFSTLFVILGFTADLKTINPEIYETPLQTIESLIHVVLEEGKVETRMSSYKLTAYPLKNKPNPEPFRSLIKPISSNKRKKIEKNSSHKNMAKLAEKNSNNTIKLPGNPILSEEEENS